jgi:hypothetical protein
MYNNSTYELLPCYMYKNKIKPHKFVFNKFMYINIISILLYSNNIENKYINNTIYFLIKYYKKYNKINFNNKFILSYYGIYNDLNFSKKNYNSNRNINNYIPDEYIKIHNKLRNF